MARLLLATSLVALVLAGCHSDGSGDIVEAPADWSQYAGDTVTVRGTAGNTPTGPIVRLPYGGYIPMNTQDPWSIQFVARPVAVTGKVVSGAGTRTEKYALDAKTVKIVEAEVPVRGAEPDPDAKVSTNGR